MLSLVIHYSPYIAGAVLLCIFLTQHRLSVRIKLAALAVHSVMNILMSFTLKIVINQPRPYSSEPGMPSAHSMFWAGFLTFQCLEFHL